MNLKIFSLHQNEIQTQNIVLISEIWNWGREKKTNYSSKLKRKH